ncbi:MAG: M81 family metallopeptidase [Pirellulaceae bacterium]|nr:M81 family metallopeptidase [Pirellulaceae bacterium]
MPRVLIAEMKQETGVFNPVPTRYDDFQIVLGEHLLETLRGTKTEVAGALDVFKEAANIEVVPTMAAWAVSGGYIPTADLDRLIDEISTAIADQPEIDAAYIVLHGAMAGETEGDPEGLLLSRAREILGDIPIIGSLDLHAILTSRMVEIADILVPYHTYPHVDHYETGQRAAGNVLTMLAGSAQPTVARVEIPMLVRGDELITATGKFGEAIESCQTIEGQDDGLAAGILIGNPFTDVPALQSNVLITTNNNQERADHEAERLARFMWDHREIFQAELTSLDEAIEIANSDEGLTVFSDAADATASGASGDSNAILRGLVQQDYQGRALLLIVDKPAVQQAQAAGEGATLTLSLGGTLDPERFTPLELEVTVQHLSDGDFLYENGTVGQGGATAVLVSGNLHIVVTSETVFVVGQQVYKSQRLDPADFDLVVVKSPNGFRPYYDAIASRIVAVDVPGSTSANLHSLPYTQCVRPIFPLDENVAPPFPQ